jgi:hypothetical protein
MKTSWMVLLLDEMNEHGEVVDDLESSTLSYQEIHEPFESGYGSSQGRPFTVWSKKRVYFPVTYDGKEWVGSVSRNPDGKPTAHIGGE